MPRNLTVEDIIASGVEGRAWRVLTCSLAWPAGEPPFVEGERVSVPAIPATPPAYDAATFDADIWTDCTRLVQDFRFNQEGNMPCDQLSLAVPAAWGAALAPAFAEMRVVVVQTRHRGSELDTGWTNLCWCLSDGYQESWDGNAHHYVVNAKSVLKLANLEILGARSGRAVYQADLVQVGAFTNRATMTLVATAADAYEYGVVDANGAVHPNWSDRPAPQFWCTNARRADGTLETEPVPLATGGEAVQAVFGEGVVRVGTTWAHTSSAKNGATDYGQGLGISEGTDPVIVGLLWRFAHPAMDDRDDTPVASDVADGLTVIASSAGSVQLSAAVRSTGLTLVLRDGTGRRYATMATDTTTDALTLTNSSITAPVDTAVSYGDANRAADVLQRMLLDCGFQQLDDSAPFYLHAPETPEVAGVTQDIVLPPLVYQRGESITALEAITRLRTEGYLPPNYLVLDDNAGQVRIRSVEQAPLGHASTIPLAAVTLNPGLQYDRSDLGVVTRVVARGLRRQVLDATQVRDGDGDLVTTISDVASVDGGLPAPAYSVVETHVRPGGGGTGYEFDLPRLFSRDIAAGLAGQSLRPWAWYWRPQSRYPNYEPWRQYSAALVDQWRGTLLCEIVLNNAAGSETAYELTAVELDASNPWWTDMSDYGGNRHASAIKYTIQGVNIWQFRPATATEQTIEIEYYDSDQATWLPLWTPIRTPVGVPASLRATENEFATRTAVSTSRLRVRCLEPFFAECGTHSEDYYHALAGIYLNRLMLWTSAELIGVAQLGSADNYGGELSGADWQAIYTRMRSRTEELAEAAPWASSQNDVDWLALAWLKDCTRDLAPRRLGAVRPDVRVWDTVSFSTPRGDAASYLVTSVTHSPAPECSISCVNYGAPYFEGE